jgi:hypothetical protein
MMVEESRILQVCIVRTLQKNLDNIDFSVLLFQAMTIADEVDSQFTSSVPCKVESGVGHAQKTPLKGKRFESLEEAQAYLDHWEERWADKRIHDRTKRQVAAMFAEEKPSAAVAAGAVPLLPVRSTYRSPGWMRRARCGLLWSAARMDRAAASCAVGRGVRAASRSPHR